MARAIPEVMRELEARIAELGYELVEVEWAGSRQRPILRIRVDRPEGQPSGVTLDDCAKVSRGLEPWLDELEQIPERYVLEVSSPGVDRPLVRPSDYRRFAGEQVAVKGSQLLAGRARRLEGELLGLEADEQGRDCVQLKLPGGDEVSVPLEEVSGGHVIYKWS